MTQMKSPSDTPAAETERACPAEDFTGQRFRHKARGSVYTVLGHAKLQTNAPLGDYESLIIYRSDDHGKLWARPFQEFVDGRFEAAETPALRTAPTGESAGAGWRAKLLRDFAFRAFMRGKDYIDGEQCDWMNDTLPQVDAEIPTVLVALAAAPPPRPGQDAGELWIIGLERAGKGRVEKVTACNPGEAIAAAKAQWPTWKAKSIRPSPPTAPLPEADGELNVNERLDQLATEFAVAAWMGPENAREQDVERLKRKLKDAALRAYCDLARPYKDRAEAAIAQRDKAVADALKVVEELHAFVAIMVGRGPDAVIPETVPSPLGPPIKVGEIMCATEALLAKHAPPETNGGES